MTRRRRKPRTVTEAVRDFHDAMQRMIDDPKSGITGVSITAAGRTVSIGKPRTIPKQPHRRPSPNAQARVVDLEGEGTEIREIMRELAGIVAPGPDGAAPLALPEPEIETTTDEPERPKARSPRSGVATAQAPRGPRICPECQTAWNSLKHREHKRRLAEAQKPS